MKTTWRYKITLTLCAIATIFIAAGFFVQTPWSIPRSTAPSEPTSTVPAPMISVTTVTSTRIAPPSIPQRQYLEVADSCGPYLDGGPCVNMRSGPGTQYPVVLKLRNGIVLKVVTSTVQDGQTWYQIGFDGNIRYPERVTSTWYVNADYVNLFSHVGPTSTNRGLDTATTKRIVVNLTKELLYAYDGDMLFMQQSISTDLELTPTALGTFWIIRKTPDSYMQGPIPDVSDQYYDLPGVPWDLYFAMDGSAIHGAYWHNHFGEPWSHGCVNLPPDQAKILYEWADLGTPVIVQN